MSDAQKKIGLIILAAALVTGVQIIHAFTLTSASVSISVQAPPLVVTAVSFGSSAPCSGSGSSWSCTVTMTQGQTASLVFNLSNPSSQSYTATSSTWVPSACGITVKDSSVTVAAGGTASLSVTFTPAATAPTGSGVCSASVTLSQ